MKQINIYEAKTKLSSLVDQVSRGESFVIAKSGAPLAKLVPLDVSETKTRMSLYGTMKGEIFMADDFDELPEDLLRAFEGDEQVR